MSMQDPIADMLVRIRNGQRAKKSAVCMPASAMKRRIVALLHEEGYVQSYEVTKSTRPMLRIVLKYFRNKPVIEYLKRVSRPGLRIYRKSNALPRVNSGLGMAVVSTSRGVMKDRTARRLKLGGEIVCLVF